MTSVNGEQSTPLSDEVSALISRGPDASGDVIASLKLLYSRFTTTPNSGPSEQALQLLGTAVGTQSRHDELTHGFS